MSIMHELVIRKGAFIGGIESNKYHQTINLYEQMKKIFLDVSKFAREKEYKKNEKLENDQELLALNNLCSDLVEQIEKIDLQLGEVRKQLSNIEFIEKIDNKNLDELLAQEDELIVVQKNLIGKLKNKKSELEALMFAKIGEKIENNKVLEIIENAKKELSVKLSKINKNTFEKIKELQASDYSDSIYEYVSLKLKNEIIQEFLAEEMKVVLNYELEEMLYTFDTIKTFIESDDSMLALKQLDIASKRIECFDCVDTSIYQLLCKNIPIHLKGIQNSFDLETHISIYNISFYQMDRFVDYVKDVSESHNYDEIRKFKYDEIINECKKNDNRISEQRKHIFCSDITNSASFICQNFFNQTIMATNMMSLMESEKCTKIRH